MLPGRTPLGISVEGCVGPPQRSFPSAFPRLSRLTASGTSCAVTSFPLLSAYRSEGLSFVCLSVWMGAFPTSARTQRKRAGLGDLRLPVLPHASTQSTFFFKKSRKELKGTAEVNPACTQQSHLRTSEK